VLSLSVTSTPLLKFAEHALPQLIPAGTLVTVPNPSPVMATLTADCGVAPIVKEELVGALVPP
jgi:hypothetical protein